RASRTSIWVVPRELLLVLHGAGRTRTKGRGTGTSGGKAGSPGVIAVMQFSPWWELRTRQVPVGVADGLRGHGQDLCPAVGDEDGVLDLRGAARVGRARRPAVGPHPGLPRAGRDHRLDREHHAGLEDGVGPGVVVVGHGEAGVELLA